jgi:hypothetical protein
MMIRDPQPGQARQASGKAGGSAQKWLKHIAPPGMKMYYRGWKRPQSHAFFSRYDPAE